MAYQTHAFKINKLSIMNLQTQNVEKHIIHISYYKET